VPLDDDALLSLAARLVEVPEIVGITLGGSRGRGEGRPDSDTDLGLYYRGSIDIDALGSLAREIAGPGAEVTPHGGWGPWVDGGGWLHIDGTPVDLIYRDLDRVEQCWQRVSAGENAFHVQTGHPLGVPDLAYPGELAMSTVLADPTGELTRSHERFQTYPAVLAETMVEGLWESRFLLDGAAKVVERSDPAYLALLLSRALLLAAHAICARAGRWVTNEKGLIAVAARQPGAPAGFAEAVTSCMGLVTTDAADAVRAASAIVEQVRSTSGGAP
jgi:hypothetical protein